VHRFINNPEVAQFIGVAGFHCWSNDPEKARELPRRVVIFETECGGNIRSHNYGFDFYWWLNKRVIENAYNGLSGVITWNMVSDENAGPHGTGPQGCRTCRGLVTVRPASSDVVARGGQPYYLQVNSEFRALMHASKYVKRGAKRVESSIKTNGTGSDSVSQVAFKNPDGSVAVIVGNPGDTELELDVVVDGQWPIRQKLAAGEAQTLVIRP
jgi:glucosylceramidase